MTRWQTDVIKTISTTTSYQGKGIVTRFKLEFDSGRHYTKKILGFGSNMEALKIGDIVVTATHRNGNVVDIKSLA